MKRECRNCRHWLVKGVETNPFALGACRLNPPPVGSMTRVDEPDRFPETRGDDVCGQHKPKAEERALIRATRNPPIQDADHQIKWIQRQDRKERDYFVVMLGHDDELWLGSAMGIARPKPGLLLAIQEGDISSLAVERTLGIESDSSQGLTACDAWTLFVLLEAACERCFVVHIKSLRWFDYVPSESYGDDR